MAVNFGDNESWEIFTIHTDNKIKLSGALCSCLQEDNTKMKEYLTSCHYVFFGTVQDVQK